MLNRILFLLFFVIALPLPAQALEGCFCAKDNLSNRKCGQVERFDPADSVTLREYVVDQSTGAQRLGAPITLSFLNFTECPKPEKAAAPVKSDPVSIRGNESFGIFGSNTIGEVLMPTLIRGYARKNGLTVRGRSCNSTFILRSREADPLSVTIECEARGSGTGVPALADGRAEIAMLSRPIDAAEQRRMASLGFPKMTSVPYETVIALDGLRIIVSESNPVRALTLRQIAQIFAGEITDWSSVGGTPGRISVYTRDSKSGTRDTFEKLVMEPFGKQISDKALPLESSGLLTQLVATNSRAIGFIGFAYQANTKTLAIREPCGIEHDPSLVAFKTEDHPLSRRLFLYRARLQSRHAQELLSFAISDDAQPLIDDAGYINQAIEALSADRTRARITAYAADPTQEPGLETDDTLIVSLLRDTTRAQRLSISFRFRFGSSELDSKASDDVLRLARYLQSRSFEGKQLLLLGFADAVGSFGSNRTLSEARANSVRRALIGTGATLDRDAIVAKGYSELLPVSCNTSDLGRQKNRRVEVYLVDR